MISTASPNMIDYGRKASVPPKCPICGAKRPELSPAFSLGDLFKAVYDGWHPELRLHPVFRIPRWYGDCRRCALTREMTRPLSETWIGRLKK